MPDIKQRYILVCPDCAGMWMRQVQAELLDGEKDKYPCYVCKRKKAAALVTPVAVNGKNEIVKPVLSIKRTRAESGASDAP